MAPALSSRRWREFLCFALVGAANTILTYGLYLLYLCFVSYPTAYSASYLCGIFISYYLNARFVFRERLRLVKALQFPVVYIAQYLVGLAALYALVGLLHVDKRLAPLLVVALTVPVTYVLSRFVIKGRRSAATKGTD
jgi:putative flippase GtrA